MADGSSGHPIEDSALGTFAAARTGLDTALAYLEATDPSDRRRMRIALGGVSAACEALKASANAYSAVIGLIQRPNGSTKS